MLSFLDFLCSCFCIRFPPPHLKNSCILKLFYNCVNCIWKIQRVCVYKKNHACTVKVRFLRNVDWPYKIVKGKSINTCTQETNLAVKQLRVWFCNLSQLNVRCSYMSRLIYFNRNVSKVFLFVFFCGFCFISKSQHR